MTDSHILRLRTNSGPQPFAVVGNKNRINAMKRMSV